MKVFALCQYLFHDTLCFTGSANTDGTLYISEEDKNEKGATADSVQQRRQYRRQNRQSSSGYKPFYTRPVLSHTQPSLFNQVFVHVILHSPSHGLLKLCLNPNVGAFSPAHTV